MIPVDKGTTALEMKTCFLEATSTLEDIDGPSLNLKGIKLWKQSTDDDGNEKWLPLEDGATVDKSGLDQGHIVGVSVKRDGKAFMRGTKKCRLADDNGTGDFPKPVIAVAVPEEQELIADE